MIVVLKDLVAISFFVVLTTGGCAGMSKQTRHCLQRCLAEKDTCYLNAASAAAVKTCDSTNKSCSTQCKTL